MQPTNSTVLSKHPVSTWTSQVLIPTNGTIFSTNSIFTRASQVTTPTNSTLWYLPPIQFPHVHLKSFNTHYQYCTVIFNNPISTRTSQKLIRFILLKCVNWWFFMFHFTVKVLSQYWHLNGLSPACTFKWTSKLYFLLNIFSHSAHWNSFLALHTGNK